MIKLIMTKGLPGCGKSTWAKQYQKDHPATIRVNKDDLRAMLHDSVHSKTRERFVLDIRDQIIAQGLLTNHNIIVDDTNLNPIHEKRLRDIVDNYNADMGNGKIIVEFEIKDFTDVPIGDCIKWDAMRANSVGVAVIKGMYNQYLKPKLPTPEVIAGARAIICDLDGTLCLFGDKNPYDRDFENDEINEAVRYILDGNDQYNEIVFISGRSDKFRGVTQKWLDVRGFGGHPLFMRRDGDTRRDIEVKREIYNEHIKGVYNVLFVIDDRPQVCRMWYSLGLPLFKFGDPDAEF